MANKDDDIIQLRLKIREAIAVGLASGDSIFEGTLINLYNKCKAQEDRCKKISHESAKKVAQADAQASAYSQMGSIVYGTLSGFLQVAKKDVLELEAQDDESLTEEEKREEEVFREKRMAKEKTMREAAAERAEMVNRSSKRPDGVLESKASEGTKAAPKKTTKITASTAVSEKSSTKKASIKKAKKKTTRRRR